MLLLAGQKTIFLAGTLAGTLDAIAATANAYIQRGTSPVRVFQYIASGVFGMEAFAGGLTMVCWGVLFHFFIACTWAALFFLAHPRIALLSRNKIAAGMVYGCIIWLIMNMVVLPLTNVPPPTLQVGQSVIGIIILMFAVGIPISFVVHKHYSTLAIR